MRLGLPAGAPAESSGTRSIRFSRCTVKYATFRSSSMQKSSYQLNIGSATKRRRRCVGPKRGEHRRELRRLATHRGPRHRWSCSFVRLAGRHHRHRRQGNRSVPLWEAIGDNQEEYNDCRSTLLADGKCTTGGGAAPVYFLELVGNLVLIDLKGGTVVAVTGLPPGTGYLIRYLEAAAGGRK
jgi:hypothetical protein